LKLKDGTPVVYEAPVGYGKVIVATGPLGKNGLRRLVLNEIEHRVIPLVRQGCDDGFHVLPRTDSQGHLFLGVFNQNVDQTLTDTLLVDGHYPQVVERSLSGDWPVPTEIRGPRTALTLRLAPGEGTVLALGSLRTADRHPRDPQSAVTPEPPLTPWSDGEVSQAEQQIARKRLTPPAKAEALALLAAARRHGSFGYYERAQRLLRQAMATTEPGRFVSFPEDGVPAVQTQAPVKVDGQADEWRAVRRAAVKSRPEAGGEFAFQWDEENLYVLAVVRDAHLKRIEEQGGDFNWIWGYDGILLVLNPANTAPLTVGGALYDARYRAAQTALLVSITGRKYANSAAGFSAAAVRSAVQEVEGGYVMEVSVPLREVMAPPVAGADLGFEFKIVDDGSEMGFARFADREGWQFDPLLFARLRLVDADVEVRPGAEQSADG
jgi:hypothetical protein